MLVSVSLPLDPSCAEPDVLLTLPETSVSLAVKTCVVFDRPLPVIKLQRPRAHQGAVERGSVDAMSAVLWNADIRGFTTIADETPGAAVIELLDEVFETLAASLRPRGAQILKFMGDGMLAIFPFDNVGQRDTCRLALDAAAEAMSAIDCMNRTRSASGKRVGMVDLALHLGEVLYGNVGAADRLDFTIIGPAVNEVARIEALCEPLGRNVLVSAEFAAAIGQDYRLELLGQHTLRGVRDARAIYGLEP